MTWNIGDQIVLASTSRSPEENEELSITSVSNDGRTIGIAPRVKYKHISLAQSISERYIETRAEVGLLTRNVVVEGSENDEWSEKIPECPGDFDPGIFAVQTCFQGRYGEEMASEQFGSQIMINAKMQSKGLVTGRISYVEVRKAGQAFGLGKTVTKGAFQNWSELSERSHFDDEIGFFQELLLNNYLLRALYLGFD